MISKPSKIVKTTLDFPELRTARSPLSKFNMLTNRRLLLAVLFVVSLVSNRAFAQFEGYPGVVVQMQSGARVNLTDLPWFKLNLVLQSSQYKNRATSADWVFFSSPKFCPVNFFYTLNWQGRLADSQKTKWQNNCSDYQRDRLKALPPEARNVCACSVIMETVSESDPNNKQAIWKSLNDEILQSDEMKLPFALRSKNDEVPLIISIGGSARGMFDYLGNKLCSFDDSDAAKSKSYDKESALQTLKEAILMGDKPIAVSCIKGMKGKLVMKDLAFSVFRMGITGTAYLNFDNGEAYELEPIK